MKIILFLAAVYSLIINQSHQTAVSRNTPVRPATYISPATYNSDSTGAIRVSQLTNKNKYVTPATPVPAQYSLVSSALFKD